MIFGVMSAYTLGANPFLVHGMILDFICIRDSFRALVAKVSPEAMLLCDTGNEASV